VTTQVIVLNGGSSSGKSGIARCLQAILPEALDCAKATAARVT
jgi:chloramphenicol 3-O phosphotransferase